MEVDLVAEMSVLNPFDFFLEPQAEKFPFEYDRALDHELVGRQHQLLDPCRCRAFEPGGSLSDARIDS